MCKALWPFHTVSLSLWETAREVSGLVLPYDDPISLPHCVCISCGSGCMFQEYPRTLPLIPAPEQLEQVWLFTKVCPFAAVDRLGKAGDKATIV